MTSIQVAAYYFPNYHFDARNAIVHGPGWNEWKLIDAARPRFPGHQQPKRPLWGYENEAEPAVMAKKIDAAADAGLDAFIFDWYYYNDGTFLEKALLDGYLQAPNRHRLRYALMWANHTWCNIHPCPHDDHNRVLYDGDITPETFVRMTDYLLENHFTRPEYWRLDGCPYFSFYDIMRLVKNFGSPMALRDALDIFRAKAQAAGLPGLHLNLTSRGEQILPGEEIASNSVSLVESLGFDSVTSYIWIHHFPAEDFPRTSYLAARDRYFKYWDEAVRQYAIPYHPNAMVGWDVSPRTVQSDVFDNSGYPYMPVIENTPEEFARTLMLIRDRLMRRPANERIITINAWNEWTEGSYLEPDEEHGFSRLEAIRSVLGRQRRSESVPTNSNGRLT